MHKEVTYMKILRCTNKDEIRNLGRYLDMGRVRGGAVAQLVEALRYKPEGCGLDSRWSHWNFSVT